MTTKAHLPEVERFARAREFEQADDLEAAAKLYETIIRKNFCMPIPTTV